LVSLAVWVARNEGSDELMIGVSLIEPTIVPVWLMSR
jgi:hypothetical protein